MLGGHYKLASKEKIDKYLENTLKNKEPKQKQSSASESNLEILEKFYLCLQKEDYLETHQYLNVLYNRNEIPIEDFLFYAYALSLIMKQPIEYPVNVKRIRYDNLKLSSTEGPTQALENKIRLSVFNQNFSLALCQMKQLMETKSNCDIREKIIEILIQNANDTQIQIRKQLLKLIKEEKYYEILEILKNITKYTRLSRMENYIFLLTTDLINIIETGEIPEANVTESEELLYAIEGQNYPLAFSMVEQHQQDSKMQEANHIYLLLEKINTTINRLKEGQYFKKLCRNTVLSMIEPNVDKEAEKIKDYLERIEKSEYEFLIIDLIGISIMNQDMTFQKPVAALSTLKNNLEFNDISDYILDFYEALSKEKYIEARTYLEIIQQFANLGIEVPIKNAMEEVLNNAEKEITYKKK